MAVQRSLTRNRKPDKSRHATIRNNAGKFILEDHSTNGTFVNDKRVTSHDLVDNDFIKFGNTLVKFKSLT